MANRKKQALAQKLPEEVGLNMSNLKLLMFIVNKTNRDKRTYVLKEVRILLRHMYVKKVEEVIYFRSKSPGIVDFSVY